MNAKHLTPLAVLAVVSVAATAWVLQSSTQTVASDRRGERVLPSLVSRANEITGLTVRESVARGTWFLGVCVGLQWLFEGSVEAPEMEGLGVFPGICTKLVAQKL